MRLVQLCLIFLVAVVASGASITNGGFDSNCAGWTFANNDGNFCPTTTGPAGQTGDPSPFAVLNNSPGPVPSMSQTVSGLVIGVVYTISWEMQSAYRCCGSSVTPGVGLEIDGNLWEFIVPNSQNTWVPYSRQFTYAGGSDILRFSAQRNGTDADVAIDNVAIAGEPAGVPEPTAMSLLLLSAPAALFTRRRG